jgi:hypothetical protein
MQITDPDLPDVDFDDADDDADWSLDDDRSDDLDLVHAVRAADRGAFEY